MKKFIWKKGVCLGLTAAMLAGLTACSKEEGNTAVNSALAKENVYSYEELSLEKLGDDYNVQDMQFINDKIYLLVNTYGWIEGTGDGEGTGEGEADAIKPEARTAAENEDGAESDSEEGNGEEGAGEEGSGEEGTGEGEAVVIGEETVENTMIDIPAGGESGIWTSATKIVSVKLDGTDWQEVELSIEGADTSNTNIYNTAFGADGSVYAVQETYLEDYSDPENPVFEDRQAIVGWTADGTQKWSIPLDDIKGDSEWAYVNRLMVSEEGTIYAIINSDSQTLVEIDNAGAISNQKELAGTDFENMGTIYVKEDGTMLVTSYNQDYTKISAFTYDPKTGTAGEKKELPGSIGMYSIYEGKNTDFVLTNNSGVYTLNIGETEPTQFMSYVNSDLPASYMDRVAIVDDEHFIGMYSDTVNYDTRVAYFTKVDPKDIPDKSVIVLGAHYLDSDVRQRVIDFNKTNSQYRITVRDYSAYSTMDDYMAGYAQLNNDIIAGNMPDILISDMQMSLSNYISKGLLADVGSLIEKDEELSQNEYMENVFEAYSVNGKLYYVVPSFTVGTVLAKSSIVGENAGWTMEEMQNVLAGLPEGTNSFGEMNREGFFSNLMSYCGSDYIDIASGKCSFDSQEFINVLEFAKTLPEEIDWNEIYGENYDWNEYSLQYRKDKTILMPTTIYQIQNMNYVINGQFGEDVTFIGFPSANRNGSVINANMSFALSAKSKVMDGAWDFVRYYLTDEYQSGDRIWGMPVSKEVFMNKAAEALKRPYWIDENGEKQEYDETFYMNDEEITLPPMSQEQVDEIVAFIESVDRSGYYNEDIINIISEEAAAFYAGQKSASEVAQIIQSRAQVYVNENR